MKNTLFLFTNEFPCSKTLEPYLEHEILFLSKAFEKIVIVPATIGTIQKSIPKNAEVLNVFDKHWFNNSLVSKLAALPMFIGFYLSELIDWQSKSTLQIKNLLADFKSYYNAVVTGKALEKYAAFNNINFKASAFYSYWFFHPVITLSILKRRGKIDSFISRGHLGDIYLDQFPDLGNFYNFKIKNTTKVLAISTHARDYLVSLYPKLKDKFVISRLAVSDMGLNPELGNEFVVVSCSTYSERKRVDLLAELLCDAPFSLTWLHFGYVPQEVCDKFITNFKTAKTTIKAVFMGDVPNHKVIEFYKSNPVNVIVNLSTSEGLPFSLIEATSFGIPIIATDVNGTPDIATSKNGFLIPKNFEKKLFYDCLLNIKNNGSEFRNGARQLFLEKYKAEINYAETIQYLKQ